MKMTHPNWKVFRYIAGVTVTGEIMEVPDNKVRYFKDNGWQEVKEDKTVACKYCGEEFENKGQLLAHYRHCEDKK